MKIAGVKPTLRVDEKELISAITAHAVAEGMPVALWRLPEAETKHLLVSEDVSSFAKGAVVEDLPQGFLFAPFDREKNSLFLKATYLFRFEHGSVQRDDTPLSSRSISWAEEVINHQPARAAFKFPSLTVNTDENATAFLKTVEAAVNQIHAQVFEKVVPSRTKTIDLPEHFDVIDAFEKLCDRYPNALISFVSIPGAGNWLGATPEALVTVEDKAIFRTVALAGTQPYRDGMNIKTVAWTQKEIEEQALVERYVISCFKKIRLREYEEHGPKTVIAGNLIHLKSDFTVDMKATNFPQLGTIMLDLLHPTSAVCGMPLGASLDFLREHEGYDRAFYAGYLGPVNIDNNIHIFVNLRCMQLFDKAAILYAGAGVTEDSDPVEELEETEMKFRTLLNVIS